MEINLKTGFWFDSKTEAGGGIYELILDYKDIRDNKAALLAYAEECRWNFENGKKPRQQPSPRPSEPQLSDPLTIARGYLKRGWNPIPVSRQTKRPFQKEWQNHRLTEETVAKVFKRANLNVGVQMGPMSGGLTDVDLDCREAVLIGAMLLPASNNVFGRASKLCSTRPPGLEIKKISRRGGWFLPLPVS